MRTKNGFTNDSEFVHTDFIERNRRIAVPYLVLLSIFTVTGCVGNILVVGVVWFYKVSRSESKMNFQSEFIFCLSVWRKTVPVGFLFHSVKKATFFMLTSVALFIRGGKNFDTSLKRMRAPICQLLHTRRDRSSEPHIFFSNHKQQISFCPVQCFWVK